MQCRGGEGACPDTLDSTAGSCTDDVFDVSGLVEEGRQCISFTRPFNPSELINCRLPALILNEYIIIIFVACTQVTVVHVIGPLIPPTRTSTLSGALAPSERQPSNTIQEQQVNNVISHVHTLILHLTIIHACMRLDICY